MESRKWIWVSAIAVTSLAGFGCGSGSENGEGANVAAKSAPPSGPPSVATPGKEPPAGPPGAMGNRGGAPGGGGQGPGGGGGRGSLGFLLGNEQVKKELAISEDQAKKLEAVLPAPGQGGGTQVSPEERQKQVEELQKKVDGILNATQKTRLQEIRYHVMGVRAFTNPEVVKALNITAEQTKKLEELNPPRGQGGPGGPGGAAPGGGNSNTAPAPGGGPNAGPGGGAPGGGGQMTPEQRQKLREERMKKALDVLTEAQRAKWKKMTGKPFVLQRRAGGGGAGAMVA